MPKNADLSAHPLKTICEAWLAKIQVALKVRHDNFGTYAEECSRFYDGNHNWMWDSKHARGSGGFLDKEGGVLPTFRVTINNVFKAVASYGPALYHQNPNVLVSPLPRDSYPPEALGVDPNDPYGMQEYQALAMEEDREWKLKQACASVKSRYINWVQQETDKKLHARRAITEAIVTGLGWLETTIFQPPASQIVMPRSTYLSWWDVALDPDADYYEDLQCIYIRRVQPVNLAERRFGLEPGELKGHIQSFEGQSSPSAKKEAKENRKGKTFDTIEYWEVFSKNGCGDKLQDETKKSDKLDYSALGDYCWLVVAKGVPYPLNCPTTLIASGDQQDIFDALQWPVPYWNDQGGWPISRLTFYENPKSVWPVSIFKPAIGEMRFLNWIFSFLADKVASSCTTYVGMLKAAGQSIQKQICGTNTPFTVVEISEALGIKNINEAISFINAPNFPDAVWTMAKEVIHEVEMKTGVTELLQGLSPHAYRSAEEAKLKGGQVSIRPDDMAARTEDFLSEVAVREIQAARWFCGPKDVGPSVGKMGAIIWQNHILSKDPDDVVRGFSYRVEAGSTRKPNKQTKIAQLGELGQYALSVFQEFAAQGNVEPYNAFMTEYCKAQDIDPAPFLVQPPQQNGPSPEEQQAQAEIDLKNQEMQGQMQLKLAELQMAMQEMQAKLGFEQRSQNQELSHAEEMHKLDIQAKREQLALKKQESQARQQATKTAARNGKAKSGAK